MAGSRLLSLKDVSSMTSLSKSTIYRLMLSGKFPAQRQITVGRVAWLSSDVDEWISTGATA